MAEEIATGEETGEYFKRQIRGLMDALYGAALRLTRDPQDAEDLVAEALTKAWAARQSLTDRSRFKAWVFRILHNTFISDYRKMKNEPDTESYTEEPAGDDEENFSLFEKLHQPFLLWWGNPEQEYINKLLREDIVEAVNALPEYFRTVVVFVCMEGLSYQEAAEALDVPEGTVRSRLKRGRGLLQKALWKQASDAGLDIPDAEQAT